MPDERPVKNLLYSELAEGTRKVGRPFLRFKDTMKDILKRDGVLDIWKSVATDRRVAVVNQQYVSKDRQ